MDQSDIDKAEDLWIASLCFNAGIRFLKSHDYPSATEALKNAIVRDPSNIAVLSSFRTAAVAFGCCVLDLKMFDGHVAAISPKAVCPFAVGLSHLLDGDYSLSLHYLAQALLWGYPNKELVFYFSSAVCRYAEKCKMVHESNIVLHERATQPPPPPPKEPTFTCPICMALLVEEMATTCGHIFCKKCIEAAITAQGKCPICRGKVTAEELIRVFLPTSS